MKIKQFVISPSIKAFKLNFQKRWSLLNYYNKDEPLLFFGFRGLGNTFINHNGYKIIIPSTPGDLPNFNIFKNSEKTIIINDCPLPKNYHTPECVKIKQAVIEIKDYAKFKPTVLGDKIYFYSGFRNFGKNGWCPNPREFIDKIQSNIDFEIITTDHFNRSDYLDEDSLIEQYYKKCFLNLNFTRGHGMTTAREFSFMGIKTLALFKNPYSYESMIKCKNIEQIVENIKIESKKINTMQPSLNPHTIGSEWLDLEYLLN